MSPLELSHIRTPPKRVISLVPSTTESLFDLGLGDCLVGVTDYCIFPVAGLAKIPRIGGVIDPNIGKIISLAPDLVLANLEENQKSVVEALQKAGIAVMVMFPRTIRETLDDLRNIAYAFRSDDALKRLEVLERTVDWSLMAARDQAPLRYFCPVWYEKDQSGREIWTTFNDDTYAGDLLASMGGENIFGQCATNSILDPIRAKNDALTGKTRYPRVLTEEIAPGKPDFIILPSEPYDFTKFRFEEIGLEDKLTSEVRFIPVDGTLIFWHGTRLAKALTQLNRIFAPV